MCGIFGYCGTREISGLLNRMAELQIHRGPDDAGFFTDHKSEVWFGLQRLSIIDIAGGHQPLSNEDGSVHIACNGEIYNYIELRQDLMSRGHRFKTNSDVEVLVHLYEEYGLDFLSRVNGMFGLVVFDSPNKRLILARDRQGIKPLYYSWSDGRLAFGSELKSVLQCPWVSRDPDWQAISSYLHLFYIQAPRTGFADVKKLDSGTMAVVENHQLRLVPYWQLADYLDSNVNADIKPQEAGEELLALLKDSAQLQMRSDVPVGAFLSGGIDSSAIVALTNQVAPSGMDTFTVAWRDSSEKMDERQFAKDVAQKYHCNSHEELISWGDFDRLLPFLAWHLEEPNADGAYVPTYLISSFARNRSKVILTGAGGDELFGGYGIYDQQTTLTYSVYKMISGLLGRGHREIYLRRAFRFPWKWLFKDYHEGVEQKFLSVYDKLGAPDELNRQMAFDLQVYLQDNILLLTDKMSMAASLEARVPLLDHRIVEFVLGLPANLKIRDGEKKFLLKQVMRDYIPERILNRRKDGFGAPISSWMQGGLDHLCWPLLENGRLVEMGVLDRSALRKLGGLMKLRGNWRWALWVLLNLELWFRFVVEDSDCPVDVKLSDLC